MGQYLPASWVNTPPGSPCNQEAPAPAAPPEPPAPGDVELLAEPCLRPAGIWSGALCRPEAAGCGAALPVLLLGLLLTTDARGRLFEEAVQPSEVLGCYFMLLVALKEINSEIFCYFL